MHVLPLNVKLFLQFWFPKFHDSSVWLCRWEALAQLTTAFGILGLLIYLSYLYDAPSRNPAVSVIEKNILPFKIFLTGLTGFSGSAAVPL